MTSPGARDLSGRGRLFVVTGPSGVGKSTVLAQVREALPQLWYSVSATTRPARTGEVDGVDYFFVDESEFTAMIDRGDLLEHARYAGHGYGTPRGPIGRRLAAGTDVLLEIELQGARQVRRSQDLGDDAVTVFIAPPSRDALRQRLAARGTEDEAAVAARLAAAESELAAAGEFDYCVANTRVADTVAELVGLIAGDHAASRGRHTGESTENRDRHG